MKPFGATVDGYGDTGCCPGHDVPRIRKWSGVYSSDNSRRTARKLTKRQNRLNRRVAKQKINSD